MKKITPLILALLIPAALSAHGVDASLLNGDSPFQALAVNFTYSTGEAMSFAVVRLFSPSSPDTEIFQTITDINGNFGFMPNEAGDWWISAEDNMGHKGEITVNVPAENNASGSTAAVSPNGSGKPSVPLAAALGVSLILNIFAVWFFAGKTRNKKNVPLEADNAH